MAAFENTSDTWAREDWGLLQNGFVTMFWRRQLFAETNARLASDGYRVVQLDAASWHSSAIMLADFAAALSFPDYFGGNLDALVDCLRDVATFDYGSDAESTGTVIALAGFDTYAARDASIACSVLEILADTARSALLIGHRFIVLVQSDNPELELPPVGATAVSWNRREWLRSARS